MLKRRDLPLNALRGFEVAARLQSLSDAAEELGVTYSAVSHQIRKLEEQLGIILFDRRRKPLTLTSKGSILLSGVMESFDRLSRATEGVGRDGLNGELKISCVPGLGTNWLIPVLGQFLKSYANLNVHVVTDFWHHPVALSDIDLGISYGTAEHAGKRVIRLGQSEFFPVCSPRIIDGLTRPRNLSGMILLHDFSEETWSRWLLEVGFDATDQHQNIYFDSAHLALEAARAGHGVAMGDRPTIQRDLAEGRLVRLFDHSVPAIHPYYVVTPPLEEMKPAAIALETWIIDRF